MSQPNNYPTFNFDTFYDPQSSDASYQQWGLPGSRSMGNHPSPSPSVRTTMTAPNPRMSKHPDMNRANNLQQDRLDPNSAFPMLAVPPVGRPRSAMDNPSPVDFMSRVVGGMHDEPWSSVRMRNSHVATARSSFSQSNMAYGTYREPPVSDIDKSDSGYYTHPPQSVISEPGRIEQELPSEMAFQMGNISVTSAPSEPTEVFPAASDQASQYSGRSATQSKATYKCSKCGELSKCPSDYKKHMLKHDKPHTCDVMGCRRAATGKGFTTINDLQRHKKSVHRIGVQKDSYQCASEHCRNRGKIWPRLDNFKQHISRMHKGEDEADLISRSSYQESYPASSEISVAPMDTTLAGIGTEKQFHGNEIDDPASGISLTPDQDSSQWTTFDPSSQGFAIDVDQSNTITQQQVPLHGRNSSGTGIQQSAFMPGSTAVPKVRQDSLNILADVASKQVSPGRSGPSRPQLSNAPQTKLEQQRQALQKFSQAIAGEIQSATSADAVDLENVLLRVLSGATSPNGEETSTDTNLLNTAYTGNSEAGVGLKTGMTGAEALKATQAITNLIKQTVASQTHRASKDDSPHKLQCERCNASFPRSCDMKKHMKRHDKPYGCTYPKCHKRFGAKSDWKRHENSQHFQLESFRCSLPLPPPSSSSTSTPHPHCTGFFQRPELFKDHLTKDHGITATDRIEDRVRKCRIGKNGQGQFWCGFCGEAGEIVKLKERRNAAWDERFDHIDKHFSKEKRGIEDWVCVEAGKRKGLVMKDMDKANFDDDDGTDDVDDEPSSPELNEVPSVPILPKVAQAVSSASKKRQLPMDDPVLVRAPKRRKRELNHFCCTCQAGPWSTDMYAHCINCSHQFCGSCSVLDGGFIM